MRRPLVVAFCLASLTTGHWPPASARPADGYDLRGPDPTPGLKVRLTLKAAVTDGTLTLKSGGESKTFGMDMLTASEKEAEVLAVERGRVTKVRTKVIAHAREETTRVNDTANTEKEAGELIGKVIVSARTAKGGWEHSLAEGKPTEKEAEALESFGTFRDDAVGLPAGMVQPGHTWEVTADSVAKYFSLSANEYSGKLKARFVRVEKVGGEECAVIETEGSVKAKLRKDKGAPGSAEMTVKLTEYRSLARGLAVKYTLTGDLKLSVKEATETAETQYELVGKMKVEGTAAVVK